MSDRAGEWLFRSIMIGGALCVLTAVFFLGMIAAGAE